jgi:hypothetical protein
MNNLKNDQAFIKKSVNVFPEIRDEISLRSCAYNITTM